MQLIKRNDAEKARQGEAKCRLRQELEHKTEEIDRLQRRVLIRLRMYTCTVLRKKEQHLNEYLNILAIAVCELRLDHAQLHLGVLNHYSPLHHTTYS